MNFLNVAGPVVFSGLAWVCQSLFYFLLFCLALEMAKRAICEIIEKLYDCKYDLYSAHFAADESASKAPPLHIV